jgi:guanylate kinase
MPGTPLRGHLYIVSAPSGAGKTTLIRRIREKRPEIRFSVSCTTRSPRPDELAGRDYHFVTRREFQQGIEADRFLEWAEVHGHFYGTEARQIETGLAAGQDTILDIDVKGASQVRCSYPQAHTIFIVPPSIEVIDQRLRHRNTESEQQVEKRLAAARLELQLAPWFDFIVVNDVLEDALTELNSILSACHCLAPHRTAWLKDLLQPKSPR